MMLLVARIIAALSAYGSRVQIAAAMAWGLTLAVVPGGSAVWFILFIPFLMVRVNQAALLGTMAVGRLFAPLFDPSVERLGYFLLTRPVMVEPMSRILSIPVFSWLRLDDSFIFGGLTAGVAIWPFSFGLFLLLVGFYKRRLAPKVNRLFRKIGKTVPWLGKFGRLIRVSGVRV